MSLEIINQFENFMFQKEDIEIASIYFSLKNNILNEVIIYELKKVNENKIIVDGHKITNNDLNREENLEINNFQGSFFNKSSFNVDYLKDSIEYMKNKFDAPSIFATIYFEDRFFVDITYMNLNFINKIRLDEDLKEIENKQINTKEVFRFM